jgi:uncharacterized protein (TIGR02145 family)
MAIPSRQIGGSTRTSLLWQISKQLEELICIRSGGCESTTSTTSTTTTVYPCPTICALGDIIIGDQTWTGCNLDVTNYQNGDPIPQVQDPTEWAALTTGAWCYYENDPLNGCTYGKLYNWYAVNDPRGLAPAGYHVPTDTDFTTLYTYLGGEAAAGGALKEAGLAHWIAPNTGATNTSGFTALPGGVRNIPSGTFNLIGAYGLWWSATDNGVGAYSLQLLYNDGGVVGWGTPYFKTDGHSVRLIKDQECCSVPNITIGTQTWTGCNLNVDTYQNGDPIPQVQDPVAWAALTTGAWCYYNNDVDNGCTYGKLYNYYAIEDPRGLIPAGYHLPTPTEIVDLYTYLGGASVAGGELKETGTTHWLTPNTGATNSSGWTGLPGGLRFGGNYLPDPGGFVQLRNYGLFWTDATIISNERVYSLYSQSTDLYVGGDDPTTGHSIRLISDTPAITTSTTTLAPSGFNTIYTHFEAL